MTRASYVKVNVRRDLADYSKKLIQSEKPFGCTSMDELVSLGLHCLLEEWQTHRSIRLLPISRQSKQPRGR